LTKKALVALQLRTEFPALSKADVTAIADGKRKTRPKQPPITDLWLRTLSAKNIDSVAVQTALKSLDFNEVLVTVI
jgi:hypothetical protein